MSFDTAVKEESASEEVIRELNMVVDRLATIGENLRYKLEPISLESMCPPASDGKCQAVRSYPPLLDKIREITSKLNAQLNELADTSQRIAL